MSLTIVPTRVSNGWLGSVGVGSCGGSTGTEAATSVGAGGRREGEKMGRSRVADNELSGIPQRGFPVCGRFGVSAARAGVGWAVGSAEAFTSESIELDAVA